MLIAYYVTEPDSPGWLKPYITAGKALREMMKVLRESRKKIPDEEKNE